jgi:hypothetical protein
VYSSAVLDVMAMDGVCDRLLGGADRGMLSSRPAKIKMS